MDEIKKYLICWFCKGKVTPLKYSPANKVIYSYCPKCEQPRNLIVSKIPANILTKILEVIS